jgi:hypothetical protein
MAGLKKKKKEKSGSPNVVLVIFLVFFFLVSIGLGIWGYYGYAGQEELKRAKDSATASAKVEKLGRRYYSMLSQEYRLAMGDKLEEKEIEALNVDRDEYTKDANGGPFKDETNKEAVKTLLDKLRKDLGENGRDFASSYEKKLKDAQDDARKWNAIANAALGKNERTEDISKKYTKNQDDFHQTASERIGKENAAALLAANTKFEAFQKVADNNRELTQELKAKDEEIGKIRDDNEKQVKQLTRRINVLVAEMKDIAAAGGGGAAPANVGRGGEFFPLVLDISPGKPLWDQPIGKIMRVELDARQVVINLGTAHGAKPELSFNIFGAGTSGRAEKQMKGSIEIVKVVDANTSIARITSLYDELGREILLNRGRLAEAPIREGDLLFNLFWGTRVAVAGYVSLTGEPSDNPAEQKRQMDDFIYMLKRNGMQVDAFVDMTNGKIEGNITSKTRYLIRGDDLRAGAEKPAPKAADDEKDKKDEPAKEAGPNAERNDLINKSSLALRSDARERGLLLMSAENFATVIGYRKARSANSSEVSAFRPSLPYAGTGEGVVVVRPKDDDKKAPDPEKKDDK